MSPHNTKPKLLLESTLNSYSQVFFSLNKWVAAAILVVTFFDPRLGLYGLSSVVAVNLLALLFGFAHTEIREGIFGFNALLFGLAMGYTYADSWTFVLFFLIALVCLLVLTAVFKGAMGKKGLPFLGLPFILAFWMIQMATPELSKLQLRVLQEVSNTGIPDASQWFYHMQHFLDDGVLPAWLTVYFKTLAATFFISSAFGGLLICLSLLVFSRIVFSLSLLGFVAAYGSYALFGADTYDLTQNLVGSNYIFFAIAIGGFYLVPNRYSYLVVVMMMPVLLFLQVALHKWFSLSGLPTFTLSFSILTLVFLNALHQRWLHRFLHLIGIQYYAPEKTVYKHLSAEQRFKFAAYKQIALPFWGQWKVSQGYDGKITHLGQWQSALDFVVEDDRGSTYREPGVELQDYYCYDKPVLAPADGYVYEIVNHVDDNTIGEVDVQRNWGNTIILNHLDGLYSQISHLKKDSFKVAIGDYVTKGTQLATCGSSGRSPEPHLHFQLQTQPLVGATTLPYPQAAYIQHGSDGSEILCLNKVPQEGDQISNVETLGLLTEAFHWIPGKKLVYKNGTDGREINLEIFTDAWNRTYLYEHETSSYAYFRHEGNRIWFTDFEGSSKGVLFPLFLSCYQVLLGYYPKVKLHDEVPLVHFHNSVWMWLQDFLAPFALLSKATFTSVQSHSNAVFAPEEIVIQSQVEVRSFGSSLRMHEFNVSVKSTGVHSIKWKVNNKEKLWQRLD